MASGVRYGRLCRTAGLAVVAALAALLVVPTAGATALPSPALLGPPPSGLPSVSVKGVSVTWDGTNISHASAEKNAFSITTNQRTVALFKFTVPIGGPNVTVARIQALYFGAVISTDQVSTSVKLGAGTATMNWTLGTFTYLLAGVYLLTASLVDSGGATVWSESFYMDATPAYHIESGLIIFLVVLGIVELWSIATVGRVPRKKPTTASSPPTPWQGTTSPPPDAEAPEASEPPASPPPPPEANP